MSPWTAVLSLGFVALSRGAGAMASGVVRGQADATGRVIVRALPAPPAAPAGEASDGTVNDRLPMPVREPASGGVIRPLAVPAASPPGDPAGPQPLGSSPPPAQSFLALPDNNTSIPPDTHGAVGPDHLMVTLNTQVRIQSRSGGVVSTVSLDSFWASLGNPDAFDPKIVYDPYGQRWIFTACADRRSAKSSLLIGVTRTTDPTGGWNLFRVDGDAANLTWVDYPSIGFSSNWIVVQVNMFTMADVFNRSHIYVFDKADLYAGGAGRHTLISRADIGGVQVPATTYDPAQTTHYLVTSWASNSGGVGKLRIFTITGAVGAETLADGPFVEAAPWDESPPGHADFAPQLGSTRKVQVNDDRIQNVVYRNGHLWCTHTVFLPAGGAPTRCSAQWWEFLPDGTVVQFGRIDDPAGSRFYAFPSIAVNAGNDALIGYSRFAASQYVSANYSLRKAGDPPNTLRDEVVLKAGEAPYYKTFSGTYNRWGDFSHTVVDPVGDADLWTIQEYAAARVGNYDRWGTWWGRIVVPPDTCTLTVASPHNVAVPAPGSHVYEYGEVVDCSVTGSPYSVVDAGSRVTSVCTGWTGTGSAPASGAVTNTGPFALYADSSVTWHWVVADVAVSNQTVAAATNVTARDSIAAGPAYRVEPPGNVTFEVEPGGTIRLLPGFVAASGSVFRARVRQ